jgi:hypothetical protein
MAMINDQRRFAFIAFWTTGRADNKGRAISTLPCRLVTPMALRSLASVALSSIWVFLFYYLSSSDE